MRREPFSEVRPDDHHLWECPDHQSSEAEVTEFIGAFVAAEKPELVVEIGAWKGYTTLEIGRALRRNMRGRLVSFEMVQTLADETYERTARADVPVHLVHADANDADPEEWLARLDRPHVDVLFIDGSLSNREQSYEVWAPHVRKGGFILVNDSLKHVDVKRFVDNIDYPKVTLYTPRGLTIIQLDS